MPKRALPAADRIAACRQDMEQMTTFWRAVAGRAHARARIEAEAQVFNQMAVALQNWFAPSAGPLAAPNAAPAIPSPNPHAITELRLLAEGVARNGGYFPSDHSVPWHPEASVTGYRPGDRIRLSEPVFSQLTEACLQALSADA